VYTWVNSSVTFGWPAFGSFGSIEAVLCALGQVEMQSVEHSDSSMLLEADKYSVALQEIGQADQGMTAVEQSLLLSCYVCRKDTLRRARLSDSKRKVRSDRGHGLNRPRSSSSLQPGSLVGALCT
jgi:hypothetical protein